MDAAGQKTHTKNYHTSARDHEVKVICLTPFKIMLVLTKWTLLKYSIQELILLN